MSASLTPDDCAFAPSNAWDCIGVGALMGNIELSMNSTLMYQAPRNTTVVTATQT